MSVEAYKKVEIETKVLGSSQYDLVLMLYQQLLTEFHLVKKCIEDKDYQKKAFHVDKATRLISDGLRSYLDIERGGDLALQLLDLYTYLNMEIISASTTLNTAKVDSCIQVANTLLSAWKDIGSQLK